jgi:uncharacterized protein YqeY
MNISEQIDARLKEAMIAKDEQAIGLYRLLKSALKNAEIEKRAELDEPEMLRVLEKEAKQRRDSIEQYRAGNRDDLAKHEEDELKVIETFLPEKMSEGEVRELVKQEIGKLGDFGPSDFGRVMGTVMNSLKGKADGALVQKIVREEMGA